VLFSQLPDVKIAKKIWGGVGAKTFGKGVGKKEQQQKSDEYHAKLYKGRNSMRIARRGVKEEDWRKKKPIQRK